ncbi:MAG: tetratricopeptide repeat protein [Parachlamydiaceae bacterium]|nr:tetratricopeptide repeat protein [Parachlamydiaceae bacterium]
MPDPYLEAMMHGDFAKKKGAEIRPKDKFDVAIEKEIDKYIDSLELERNVENNKLASPAMRRAQIKAQMKADLQMPEVESFITSAISILLSEGAHYLLPEQYNEMEKELKGIKDHLDSLDLGSSDVNIKFQNLVKISDSVMNCFFHISVEKFKEKEFPASLSLFSFLTILDPGNIEYLYRLGIAAQNNKNYELALKAYEASLEINHELLGALLFASECYFRLKERELAITYLKKAKNLAETQPLNDIWEKLIYDLEKL